MLARYDPVGKRTAVVTTVEISLYGEDGGVARVGGDLAERVRTHGDDRATDGCSRSPVSRRAR